MVEMNTPFQISRSKVISLENDRANRYTDMQTHTHTANQLLYPYIETTS